MALNPKRFRSSRAFQTLRRIIVWAFLFYLRCFARIALLFFRGTIIGIAGAVGKSTTRNALAAILSPWKRTLVITGNSETGIPLGLLGIDIGSYRLIDFIRVTLIAPWRILFLRSYEIIVVEMGIDGPLPPKNMRYLLTIIQPHIGILVNESPAHVANYESFLKTNDLDTIVRYITEDDGHMFKRAREAIICSSDPYIADFATTLPKHKIRTVGKRPEDDITLSHYQPDISGTRYEYDIHAYQRKETFSLILPRYLLPEDGGIALGAAILAALSLGIDIHKIKEYFIASFTLPPGRGTILQGIRDSIIIDSSYNSSSASTIALLHAMKHITKTTRRPTWFVMGDMKELGSFALIEHARVARAIPGSVHHVLLVGQLTKELVLPKLRKTSVKTLVHVDTSKEAGAYLREHLPERSIILFKGSQLLEETIKYILQHKSDTKHLCRQDAFWRQAKLKHDTWVEI